MAIITKDTLLAAFGAAEAAETLQAQKGRLAKASLRKQASWEAKRLRDLKRAGSAARKASRELAKARKAKRVKALLAQEGLKAAEKAARAKRAAARKAEAKAYEVGFLAHLRRVDKEDEARTLASRVTRDGRLKKAWRLKKGKQLPDRWQEILAHAYLDRWPASKGAEKRQRLRLAAFKLGSQGSYGPEKLWDVYQLSGRWELGPEFLELTREIPQHRWEIFMEGLDSDVAPFVLDADLRPSEDQQFHRNQALVQPCRWLQEYRHRNRRDPWALPFHFNVEDWLVFRKEAPVLVQAEATYEFFRAWETLKTRHIAVQWAALEGSRYENLYLDWYAIEDLANKPRQELLKKAPNWVQLLAVAPAELKSDAGSQHIESSDVRFDPAIIRAIKWSGARGLKTGGYFTPNLVDTLKVLAMFGKSTPSAIAKAKAYGLRKLKERWVTDTPAIWMLAEVVPEEILSDGFGQSAAGEYIVRHLDWILRHENLGKILIRQLRPEMAAMKPEAAAKALIEELVASLGEPTLSEFYFEALVHHGSTDDIREWGNRWKASLATPEAFDTSKVYTAKEGGWTGKFLKRNDPRGLFLGQHTNCCQHPAGAGAKCAWHGQESPHGGFFVWLNAEGEIQAQAWVWKADNGVCFDNIEAKAKASNSKVFDRVRNILNQVAEDLPGKVTLGTGYDIGFARGLEVTEPLVPMDYTEYRDSKVQVLVKGGE